MTQENATRNFRVTECTRVFEGFLSVDRMSVQIDEHTITRLVVERGDAVGVLIRHKESDSLLLVRQFRAPLIRHHEPWLIEIAAGMVDGEETAEAAAIREVEEELGYGVTALKPLGQIYSTPGGASEMLTLFFAEVSEEDRTGAGGGVDEHEDIEILYLPTQEVVSMVHRGELRDAKTQVAILKAIAFGYLR